MYNYGETPTTYYNNLKNISYDNYVSQEYNLLLFTSIGLYTLIYFYKNDIFNIFFTKNNSKLKPLKCSYCNLFNYINENVEPSNNDISLETYEDSNDIYHNELETHEIETDDNTDSEPEDILNKSKHIFLTTNYNDVMTDCNNPFYKDNNIRYYLSLEKEENYIKSDFINNKEIIIDESDNEENQKLINVIKLSNNNIIEEEKDLNENLKNLEYKFLETNDLNELYEGRNESKYDKRIYLPSTWKINSEDNNYINFIIEEKKIDQFFTNLLKILRCYYANFETTYKNVNIIYNEKYESHVFLNQANISFKDDEYITYNLLNIRDLYAYTNQETKILDYNKVDFNNEELKEYYTKTIEDFTEADLKSLFKQIY